MQCVILAGGLGTRMRPHTETVPKTLIDVCGMPFAHWQLEYLAAEGVTRVLYCIGHLGDSVRDYVRDGSRWGIEVDYVSEGENLAGTAGALRHALDVGVLEPFFFVLYGDSYVRIQLREVEERFLRTAEPALMTVYRNNGLGDRSNAIFDGVRVVLYDKFAQTVPDAMVYIDYGVSVLSTDILLQFVPRGVRADLAPIYNLLSRSGRLAGLEASNRFYEIGSPRGLEDLQEHLRHASR